MSSSRDVNTMVVVSVSLNFQRKIDMCMVQIHIKISNTKTALFFLEE